MGCTGSKPPPPDAIGSAAAPDLAIHELEEIRKEPITTAYDVEEKVLGSSSHSVVKRAKRKSDGLAVAVKTVMRAHLDEDALVREIKIMRQQEHSSVVTLYDVFIDEKNVHLVLELVPGGDLHDMLTKLGRTLSEFECANVMRQLLEAVAHVHEKGFIHRDLKLENVLVIRPRPDSEVKLADFGFAKEASELAARQGKQRGASAMAGVSAASTPTSTGKNQTKRYDTVCGTLEYCAPEMLNKQNYDVQVDIYAAGVIMYSLLSGVLPIAPDGGAEDARKCAIRLRHEQLLAIEKKSKKGGFINEITGDEVWTSVSDDAKDLLEAMLNPLAKKRPQAAELLAHKWFKAEDVGLRF